MAEHSSIEWTDATWQPITGCSVISPGCINCYAMRLAGTRLQHHASRAGLTRNAKAGPVWTGEVRLNEQWLTEPLRWRRARKIFVCAHSDLFHESVPDAWIDRVFAVMALAPQHTFQVLTKRSARMRAYVSDPLTRDRADAVMNDIAPAHWCSREVEDYGGWPLPNVWLGVSAEDQRRYDERKLDLQATPAVVHFFSFEPLLGSIRAGYLGDWAIVGGESGPGARPMHPDWARDIRDQCKVAGVPFHFKQCGEFREFDTKSPTPEEVDNDSETADAMLWGAVQPSWITSDGCHILRRSDLPDDETPCRLIERVGKARAGRLLDGIEHNGMPGAIA